MALALNTTIRNAQMDAITSNAGASAKLRIYSGTRPASGAAVTSQTLLAELTCNASAFAAAAANGQITMGAVSTAVAAATGTATWARLVKSDGTTWIGDMDVGTAGTDVIINSTSVVSGANVTVSAGTFTAGNA